MKRVIRNIILIIAIFAFLFSGYKLISILLEYKEGEETYSKLTNDFVTVTPGFVTPQVPDIPVEEEPAIEVEAPITVDFQSLKEYNPDIIGWIYCPDTTINYPVLKAENNDYYLRRMADRKYNIAGSIFMDFRNKGDFSDINTIIYGHNMKNSTMFSDITNYDADDQAYFNEHPYIYYLTEEKNYIFKIIGEKDVVTTEKIFNGFITTEKMHEYLIESTTDILFDKEYNISSIQNLVTLSTCSKNSGETRKLVFCIPFEIK